MKYMVRNLEGKCNVPELGDYEEGIVMMKYNEIRIRKEEAYVR